MRSEWGRRSALALADCQYQDLLDYGIFKILLARVDAINLTQWREGAKGAKMRLLRCYFRSLPPCHSRSLLPVIPILYPVIPAKAGIQKARNTKSSMNSSQRIPSPFMGLQG